MTATTRTLLTEQQDAWTHLLEHPFVIRTADGSLPSATFDRWLVEDHTFVRAFERFLTAVRGMAPDDDARAVLDGGLAALAPELALFEQEAGRRGLRLDAEPALVNLGYTSYLLTTVDEGWPVAITALYAVEKAYYDAWASVRDSTPAGSPYAGFVTNWSSPEFAAYVDDLARLVDRVDLTEPVRQAFDRVVRFELAFWDLVHDG